MFVVVLRYTVGVGPVAKVASSAIGSGRYMWERVDIRGFGGTL
jgi:hypothetical protein